MSTTATMKPLQEAHTAAEPKLVQTKTLTFNPVHRGDCEQDGGTLVFHSDGTGLFHCTLLTYHTHSGDVWHASFAVKGPNGAVLFTTPTFDGPRMNDGNPPPKYPWTAVFSFLPEWWQGITSATQYCNC